MATREEISILEQRWSSCKYKPEFDKMLQDHLSKGLSFLSFNIPGGVSYSTLITWTKRFPSFAQAREIGEKHKLQLLEEEGIKMVKGGNVIAWKFLMNQLGHSETRTIDIKTTHTGNVSISPHMQVPASIRYTRLQKIKELHQRVSLEEAKVVEVDYDIFDDD